MDFGEALRAIKSGRRLARSGWNGKGMWLTMMDKWSGDVSMPFHADWGFQYAPFIAMLTADRKLVPWLCSQTDMLADDWILVD